MKKILTAGLFLTIVMIAAAWSIGWFIQAGKLEKDAQLLLSSLDPALGKITAESVKVSGFPDKMNVTYTKPTYSVNTKSAMEYLYKRAAASTGNSAAVLTAPEYPDANMTVAIDGSLSLSLNAMGTVFEIKQTGNSRSTISYQDQKIDLLSEIDTPSTCAISLKSDIQNLAQSLWKLESFFNKDTFLERLAAASCHFPGQIATDMATNQMAYSNDPGSMTLKNSSTKERLEMALNMDVKGVEFMPAGDDLYNRMIKMMTPAGTSRLTETPSLYGRQTILFDGNMSMARNQEKAIDHPIRFELKQFYMENATGKANFAVKFANTPQGDNQQGEVIYSLTSDSAPKQTEIARIMLKKFLNEGAQMQEFQAVPFFADLLNKNKDKVELEAVIYDALPDVTQLGQLKMEINASYNVNQPKKEGTVTLKNLEISSRDYGVMANADFSTKEGAMMPIGNASVTCKNCIEMIDVLDAYMKRVDPFMKLIEPNHQGIPPGVVESAKGFLGELGTKATPESKDLQFAIIANESGVTVNSKNTQELMELSMKHTPSQAPVATDPAPAEPAFP